MLCTNQKQIGKRMREFLSLNRIVTNIYFNFSALARERQRERVS